MAISLETTSTDQSFTDDYLLYLLAQASAGVSSEFHETLAKDNLSVSTWRILASLYPRKKLNVGRLASDCLLKQPTLTRALDRLVKSDLVKRNHSSDDRRGVIVQLTEKGFKLTKRKVFEAQLHERKILQNYTDLERKDLKDALRLLIKKVKDD